MSITKKILTQSGIYFAGTLFSVTIGLFFKIYISKKLGAEILGVYTLGMTLVTVLSVFLSLGLGNGLVRFVSKYLAQHNFIQLHTYLRKTYAITLIISIISASLFFIFPGLISTRLLKSSELTYYLPLFGVLLIINAIITLCDQTLRGLQEVRRSVIIGNFIRLPLKVLVAVSFITMGYQLGGYIIGEIVGALIALALFILLINRLLPKQLRKLTLKTKSKITKEERNFGANMLLINAVGLLQSEGDKLLLVIYLSTTDLGIYSIALTVVAFVPIILASVNSIFTPIISQLHAENRMIELQKYYQNSSKYIFVLTFPLIVFLFIFNQPILSVFGEEFKLGGQALTLLLFGQILFTSTGSVGMMLNMTGYEDIGRNSTIFTSILSLIMYLLLIPKYGLIGVATVKLVAISFQSIYSVYMLYAKQRIHAFGLPYMKIILLFISFSCLLYSGYVNIGIFNRISEPIILFLCLISIYMLFMVLFAIFSGKEERQVVHLLIKKKTQ